MNLEKNMKKGNESISIKRKFSVWFLSGICIFPVLITSGIALNLITQGKVNLLFWMIKPSIIFEELLETHYAGFSDSKIANLVFILIFWFTIGALSGWIVKKSRGIKGSSKI